MSQLDDKTKQALRLASVGALLHNLGKVNAKFLGKKINNPSNDYLYQHILGLITSHANRANVPGDWQTIYDVVSNSNILNGATSTALKTAFQLPAPLNDRTDYTVGDLIEYLGQGEPWYKKDSGRYGIKHIFPGGSRLTHLMNRAHRGASGGEKEDIATAQQPDATDLYFSTPFGYETAAANINNINNLLQQIETAIQKYLTSPADPFLLADFIAELRPLLSQAIADTQRPLNDVTVGDIGHAGMAFLLTQAAEWILTTRNIDHHELAQKEADNTLLWRLLTIHADSLRYLEESPSLADLRSRWQQLQQTFAGISQKLEETLLAVEIYADEQRRLFVVPNNIQGTPDYQAIENIVAAAHIDGLRLTSHLSDPLTNHPDDKKGGYIGDQALTQLQVTPPYDFDAGVIAAFWQKQAEQKQNQVCTACNLRPQGYGAGQIDAYKHNTAYYQEKAQKRNICCICMDRRAGVAKKWAEDNLDGTVWLDEVADSNGRLALVVGNWDIASFIKGINYPKKKEGVKESQEPDFFRRLDHATPWLRLISLAGSPLPVDIQIGRPAVTYRQNALGWYVGEQGNNCPNKFKRLTFPQPAPQPALSVENICLENGEYFVRLANPHGQSDRVQLVGQQFEVVDDYTLTTIDEAGRNRIADIFLHDNQFIVTNCVQVHPTTPNYSFARLRRIWQTTQTFWEIALTEPNQDGKPTIPPVACRLQIKGNLQPNDPRDKEPGLYHTYDFNLTNGVKLSVVWDPKRKLFITCDNLDYLAKPELLGQPVLNLLPTGKTLTIEEPTGYGGQSKEWGKITIEQAGEMENSGYTPYIPILAQPRTFMALVPADKALDVVNAIKTRYAREMGKVRNRLPLHLGLVYFHRRTPLRAALDAGRRMLNYELGMTKDEVWRVKTIVPNGVLTDARKELAEGTQQFSQTAIVELEQNGRSLTWYVPAKMGDGQTDDNWYPYVFIKSAVNGRQRIFKAPRPKSDGATEECWLIHAAELKEGDQVYFTPATLDFEWLGSAGQRFEIAYDEKTGQRRANPIRPYLLDELDTLQEAWSLIAGANGLSNNQIYALRNLIGTKRESWRPTAANWKADCQSQTGMFWQFCRDAFANANWKEKPKTDFDRLANWAVSGLFSDVIHLYMGIMKQKPQREETNNE